MPDQKDTFIIYNEPSAAVDIFKTICDNSKEARNKFAQNIVTAVREGFIDPLKMHIMVKNTESILESIKENKEYRECCLEEANKYGKKFDKENASFEIKEVGVKYNYAGCNDPILAKLTADKEILDAKIKKQQDFLKGMPTSGRDIRFGDELITVYPPVKTSTTAITVSLK